MTQIDCNKFWSAAFDTIDDLIMIIDKNFNLVKVNISFLNLLKKENKDVIGRKCYELIHRTDAPPAECPFLKTLKTKAVEDNEIYESSLKKWFLVHTIPIFNGGNEITASIHFARDITQRKQTEEALRQKEEYFQAVTENSLDTVIIADKKGIMTYVSPSAERFSGYKPQDLIGKSIFEFIHPAELLRAIYDFSKAIQTKDISIYNSFRVRHKDGSERVVEGLGKNLLDHPVISGFVMNLRDITERKQAEEALRRERNRAQEYLDIAGVIIVILNADHTIALINKKGTDCLGYEESELIGKNWFDIAIPKRKRPGVKSIFRKLMTGEIEAAEYYENPVVTRKGEERIIIWHNTVLTDERGKIIGTLSSGEDITERKKAEQKLQVAYEKLKETQQELIQSAKMAAMGHLMAGISHELSQPLTGIKGFAQAIVTDMKKNDPLKKDVQKIVEQSNRMDMIIKNMRFFAKRSECKNEKLDINKPIQDSLLLIANQFKVQNIRIKTSLVDNLPRILGDSNQLQQVFLNLLTNAKDAINRLRRPRGGEITIKTSLHKDKKSIEIIFQDTGCGISKENLENIFNPFFTTKSPDAGMGLGLSIVHRIISSHKGKIEVRSKKGKGTMFRIILPAIRIPKTQTQPK